MNRKMDKRHEQEFHRKESHMTNEHVKRYSTWLAIRQTQIKTIMRCHFTLIQWAKLFKILAIPSLGGASTGILSLVHCQWEYTSVGQFWKKKKILRYFLKLKINITYAPDFYSLTCTQETYVRVFIAALFTIAKTWKQPKYPTTE